MRDNSGRQTPATVEGNDPSAAVALEPRPLAAKQRADGDGAVVALNRQPELAF
jgi:hypothetical protein